ncbi:MAG: hypothetical protein AAFV80_22100, partial [Bacteroidota bacterium]
EGGAGPNTVKVLCPHSPPCSLERVVLLPCDWTGGAGLWLCPVALYMAITHRAFKLLIDKYYDAIDATKKQSGLESSMAITAAYISFCEEHVLYADCMLEYISIMGIAQQENASNKMTEAMSESAYFKKCQEIQQLPTRLSIQEIQRGQKDGSVVNTDSAFLISLKAWMLLTGFAKLMTLSKDGELPMYKMPLEALKAEVLQTCRFFLLQDG